jgi:DNA-binding LytR/AlgR family response regulator
MQMTQPLTLAALLGAGAVLGVMGPFDTSDHLGLFPRLAYWIFLTGAGYGIGSLVGHVLSLRTQALHFLLRTSIMAPITGGLITLVVMSVNYLVFGLTPGRAAVASLAGTTIAIAWIVTAVLIYSETARPDTVKGAAMAPGPTPPLPPILERLPLELRGPLVALSVEDHYVWVQTTKGSEMVLLRLSDAMRETGGVRGAQVHRSHWVALDQVAQARREKDRAILTLTTGAEIPVSRANLPKIKDAGLLPK